MRLPFRFTLPVDQLPPSFKFQSSWQWAHVKYSVCAVGARKGRLTPNRRHRVPFPVLPIDELGTSVRKAGETQGWKRFSNEDSIRKGLWGDYSKVQVEGRLASYLRPVSPPLSLSLPPVSRVVQRFTSSCLASLRSLTCRSSRSSRTSPTSSP